MKTPHLFLAVHLYFTFEDEVRGCLHETVAGSYCLLLTDTALNFHADGKLPSTGYVYTSSDFLPI